MRKPMGEPSVSVASEDNLDDVAVHIGRHGAERQSPEDSSAMHVAHGFLFARIWGAIRAAVMTPQLSSGMRHGRPWADAGQRTGG